MTITKVKYEKLFPTGAYLNEKIGFEAELGTVTLMDEKINGLDIYPQRIETPQEVIEHLRNLAEEIHKKQYPYLYTSNGKPITIEQSPEGIINKQDEKKLIEPENKIDNCTTVEELKELEGDALKYGLVEQYLNKKKSLSK